MTQDPEISAIAAVCAALGGLGSDDARQRVLDFAASKFGLKTSKKVETPSTSGPTKPLDDADFFVQFDQAKPSAAVYMLVARHYAKFGAVAFTVASLREDAASAGLVVPARIDKTLVKAAKKGKKLFQQISSGKFRATVYGERFLQATYKVKKGQALSSSADD